MRRLVAEDTPAELNLEDPGTYRFWWNDCVRPADVDATGRVGGDAIGIYFEEARAALFEAAGLVEDGGPVSTTVGRLAIDRLATLSYPAELRIGSRILQMDAATVRSVQAIFRDRVCVATAEIVTVLFDERQRAPRPLTPAQRRRLKPYG